MIKQCFTIIILCGAWIACNSPNSPVELKNNILPPLDSSPIVSIIPSKTELTSGDTLKISLQASDSTLANGSIDFSDGTIIQFNHLRNIFDTTIVHIYSQGGTYNIYVKFSDGNMTTSSLLTITVFPQIVWRAQSSGTTATLRHVCFTDANTGTVVGDNGIILRTINGGTTWIKQTSGTVQTLYGVSFINANIGTAVGDNGTILRTTNGGTSWTQQSSGTTENLPAVSLADTNTGTAVGAMGAILHTTDGGKSWINQSCKTCAYTIYFTNVYSIDKSHVVTIGWMPWEFEILRTTDGGENWINVQSFSVKDESHPSAISFCDTNTGIFVYWDGMMLQDFSLIYRTTDGGITWAKALDYSAKIPPLYDVSFTSINNGTVVGENGTILHTTNGGITWTLQPSGTTKFLFGVSCPDANTGTVVGESGIILHTIKIGG
jgi:photosystem II stability/assembly factor-like uncharacterized protein